MGAADQLAIVEVVTAVTGPATKNLFDRSSTE
jgi:hypothetical protein